MTAVASPPSTFFRPFAMPQPVEETFRTHDGVQLFYRAWWPGGSAAVGDASEALIIFHRGHEHSGRFEELIEKLGVLERGIPVFAWDARGHGKSPGDRGHAPSFMTIVRDVESFIRHISFVYNIAIKDMSILAHSVGSVAVSTWVHDYAPPIRKLVLVAPAFRVKLYVPLALPALRMLHKIKPAANVKSYVTGDWLTHDKKQAESYDNDPLISKQIAVNILLEMHDTATRVIADAAAIGVPTFVLTAGMDKVVKNEPIEEFFNKLSSPAKQLKNYPNFYHAILCETERSDPIYDIKKFLEEKTPPRADTSAEEKYTRDEFEALSKPLAGGFKSFKFAMQRKLMSTIGKLSHGIRIGLKTGFDSGESLDHVYGDKAKADAPFGLRTLGKVIDRNYIDAIGWQGIRTRRTHMQWLLEDAILRVRANRNWNGSVRILDIAAGPGRYLLEILKRHQKDDIVALLRDWSETGLAQGREIASELGITSARFERGDAFSENDVASALVTGHKPNIVIVSGLYELFPDNAKVEASLRGLARAVEPGGFLLYTGQPWHPQVEMIARTLTNRDGKPWIMRRRTQAEMDRLVRDVGFEKLRSEVDDAGIFTVSLAQRRA
jgi:alpha-beta hydrolase superfamily lysophospholipase/SAM-dependent methyltransferase